MGTSSSPEQLVGKLADFRNNLVVAQRDGVRAAALLVTTSVRTELRGAAPSGRLSGVGRRGAKISVGFDAPKATVNPQALVRMRGPAHLIENPTRPHAIRPRRRSRGRQEAARALTVRGVGMRASVQHPGTRGKHPWARGVKAAEPMVLPTIEGHVHAALVKAMR